MKILTFTMILMITLASASLAEAQEPLTPRDKALIQEAFDGDLAEVEGLVRKGAAIDAADPHGRTALMWAAAKGHTQIVEFLLGAGANVNSKDRDGQTPLMYASRNSSVSSLELLLNNGAEVNAQSKKRGMTALIIAASYGDEDMVRLLLEHGADKTAAENDGTTAADRARINGHSAIVALLEEQQDSASTS